MINYFEILNVSEYAEEEVIHAAYRGLAKKYHPDTTKFPKEIAEEKMIEINEAYRILSDVGMRESHRKELKKTVHESGNRKNNDNSQREHIIVPNAENADEIEAEGYGIGFYIMICVVFISFVCCILYFIPELLSDTWNNIQQEIKEIISTF